MATTRASGLMLSRPQTQWFSPLLRAGLWRGQQKEHEAAGVLEWGVTWFSDNGQLLHGHIATSDVFEGTRSSQGGRREDWTKAGTTRGRRKQLRMTSLWSACRNG